MCKGFTLILYQINLLFNSFAPTTCRAFFYFALNIVVFSEGALEDPVRPHRIDYHVQELGQ